jgi:hypothetical protein
MMDNGKKANLTDMESTLIKRIIDILVIFNKERRLAKL